MDVLQGNFCSLQNGSHHPESTVGDAMKLKPSEIKTNYEAPYLRHLDSSPET